MNIFQPCFLPLSRKEVYVGGGVLYLIMSAEQGLLVEVGGESAGKVRLPQASFAGCAHSGIGSKGPPDSQYFLAVEDENTL